MNKQSTKLSEKRGGAESGFSTIELVIVALILMTVSAMALVQLTPTLQQQQANSAMIEARSSRVPIGWSVSACEKPRDA